MVRLIPWAIALLAASIAGPPGNEVGQRLVELGSADGAARQSAERWLAAHVGRDDATALARAAREGDTEVRRRLSRIVAAVDADLWLSTLFLAQPDGGVRAVGERALRARVSAWSTDLARPGLVDRELVFRIRSTVERSWPETLRLSLDTTLGRACALLVRRGRLPLGLVVAPEVADRVLSTQPEELVGTWDEIVTELARRASVGLEGHDMEFAPPAGVNGPRGDGARGAGPAAFLRFCVAGTQGTLEASEHLLARCVEVLASPNLERRVAAARALADSGWPAGLAWLDARYGELADEAALEGLLRAASSARIAPALERPQTIRALVEAASAELHALGTNNPGAARDREDLRAFRIVDALSQLAPVALDDANARATGTDVLDGFEAAQPAGRWVRLAILEGIGAAAAEPTRAAAAAVLASEAPPWLLRQALRTWCAVSVGRTPPVQPAPIARVERLFEGVDESRAFDVARSLAHANFELPTEWRDPAYASAFAWLVVLGDADAAAARWRAADLSTGSAFRSMLARLVAEHRETLVAAWQLARAELDPDDLRQLDVSAIVCGAVRSERGERIAAPLVTDEPTLPSDEVTELLGAVAGWGTSPVSERARRSLARILERAVQDRRTLGECEALLDALARSVIDLLAGEFSRPVRLGARGRGLTVGDAWRAEVQALPRRYGRGPVRSALSSQWPPSTADAVDLATLDPRP